MLASLILYSIGIRKSYHCYDGKEWKSWDEENVRYLNGNPLRPFIFNNKLKLLHCHVDDFPFDLGKSLQAIYLKENIDNFKDYIVVKKYIGKYYQDNTVYKLTQYKKIHDES